MKLLDKFKTTKNVGTNGQFVCKKCGHEEYIVVETEHGDGLKSWGYDERPERCPKCKTKVVG